MSHEALETLLQAETARRDQAATVVRQCALALQRAQAQGQQLVAFAQEYQERWAPQSLGHATPQHVHEYTRFMQRLQDAQGQQDGAVLQAQARLQAAQRALQERELRLASVGKLLQRRQSAAQVQAQRREQKQLDEFAQRPRPSAHASASDNFDDTLTQDLD